MVTAPGFLERGQRLACAIHRNGRVIGQPRIGGDDVEAVEQALVFVVTRGCEAGPGREQRDRECRTLLH